MKFGSKTKGSEQPTKKRAPSLEEQCDAIHAMLTKLDEERCGCWDEITAMKSGKKVATTRARKHLQNIKVLAQSARQAITGAKEVM